MATVTDSQIIIDTLKQQENDLVLTKAENKQTDIEYHPDRAKWQARTARRLGDDASLLTTVLPEGFPKELDSPLVWEGKAWKDDRQWVYELSAAELKEVDDAVKHFRSEWSIAVYVPCQCYFRRS